MTEFLLFEEPRDGQNSFLASVQFSGAGLIQQRRIDLHEFLAAILADTKMSFDEHPGTISRFEVDYRKKTILIYAVLNHSFS